MTMSRTLWIAAFLVVACSETGEQAVLPNTQETYRAASDPAEAAPPAREPVRNGVLITKGEFGEEWPYTVESGFLYCDPPGSNIVMASGGKIYALNGTAMGNAALRGYVRALETIRRRDEHGFPLGDVGNVLGRARELSMCD